MTIRITSINKSGGYRENPHEARYELGKEIYSAHANRPVLIAISGKYVQKAKYTLPLLWASIDSWSSWPIRRKWLGL